MMLLKSDIFLNRVGFIYKLNEEQTFRVMHIDMFKLPNSLALAEKKIVVFLSKIANKFTSSIKRDTSPCICPRSFNLFFNEPGHSKCVEIVPEFYST